MNRFLFKYFDYNGYAVVIIAAMLTVFIATHAGAYAVAELGDPVPIEERLPTSIEPYEKFAPLGRICHRNGIELNEILLDNNFIPQMSDSMFSTWFNRKTNVILDVGYSKDKSCIIGGGNWKYNL